jgi:hypothetical protein
MAFKTIQEGIDFAFDGDTVIVAQGTYVENIFMGANIILRSAEPLSPEGVQNTVIQGNRLGPVVTFSGTEDQTCVLLGFTIRGGSAEVGGGVSGNGTHATIQNNIITDNWANCGGGVAFCEGVIRNNRITGNSAEVEGGGLCGCHAAIQNNTIAVNSAGERGGGLFDCTGVLLNCIIWENAAPSGAQLLESAEPNYCCVQHWLGPGEGNIIMNPMFVGPGGADCRLFEPSPCIDTGKNEGWMRDAVDLDGKPRILMGASSMTVDMGAYEYGSFAFRVMDLVRDGGDVARLTWASRAGDTYTVWSCDDLSGGEWAPEGTLSSEGEVTTWTDPYATSAYKLYRIEIGPK